MTREPARNDIRDLLGKHGRDTDVRAATPKRLERTQTVGASARGVPMEIDSSGERSKGRSRGRVSTRVRSLRPIGFVLIAALGGTACMEPLQNGGVDIVGNPADRLGTLC